MTRSYTITGMTCNGCAQTVHDLLKNVPGVKDVLVSLANGQATIETGAPIETEILATALNASPYGISGVKAAPHKSDSAKKTLEHNRALVHDYITAVGQRDYKTLDACLHPDFEFKGLISYHTSAAFIRMLKEHAESPATNIVVKNEIKAVFVDEGDACVIYDLITDKKVNAIPCAEWIKIADGKIQSSIIKFEQDSMRRLMAELKESSSARNPQ